MENETAPAAAAPEATSTEATSTETTSTEATSPEATTTTDVTSTEEAPAAPTEDISYHAVEKEGVVTAIWEMAGRKHIRTIDPRSRQGQDILRLYTTEHHDEPAVETQASNQTAS